MCTLGGESTAMGRNLAMVMIMMECDWLTFPGINMILLRKQIGPHYNFKGRRVRFAPASPYFYALNLPGSLHIKPS